MEALKMKRGTPDHPKLAHLCAILNISKAEAIGTLELLWHFTAKFAPQGDIGKYSDLAIAAAVGWSKPTGARGVTPECKLSDALVEAKWLDRSPTHRLVVHDWSDHADQSVRKNLSRHGLDFVRCVDILPEPMPEPEPLPTTPVTPGSAAQPEPDPPSSPTPPHRGPVAERGGSSRALAPLLEPRPDERAAAQLWRDCRALDPEASPSEIAAAWSLRASRLGSTIRNPIGVLLTAVPGDFEPGGLAAQRREASAAASRSLIELETQQREYSEHLRSDWERILADPTSDPEERLWAAFGLDSRGCQNMLEYRSRYGNAVAVA